MKLNTLFQIMKTKKSSLLDCSLFSKSSVSCIRRLSSHSAKEVVDYTYMIQYDGPPGTRTDRHKRMGRSSYSSDFVPPEGTNVEKCSIRVVFDGPAGRERFRLGKTSFSADYVPQFSKDVTEVFDPENLDTENKVQFRCVSLMECKAAHVVRSRCSRQGLRMLIADSVQGTMLSWIQEKHGDFNANNHGKWFDFIRDDLFNFFRQFAVALMEIHAEGFIFNGKIDDVVRTTDGLKLLEVINLKPLSKERFDDFARSDVIRFGQFFLCCLGFPKYGNIRVRQSKFTSRFTEAELKALECSGYIRNSTFTTNFTETEIEALGWSDEVVQFLYHQLAAEEMKNLPPAVFLKHPMLFGDVDKDAYMKTFSGFT